MLFKELIIDHVIPETTAKDAERLADLRITHALGVDFDIQGDENLAPACHACNSDKLAHLFSPERAALILTQVKERLPKFKRLKARYQKQASVENTMLGVSVALETGLISPAELGEILRRHETGDPKVNLYQSLQFVGGVSVAALRRSEVDRLFDEPLALPGSQLLDVEHADGRTREIRTTREYRDAIAQGFVPTCNAMVSFATLFDLPLAVFTAMERAQPARISFIREPRTGIVDLKYMPVSMLPKGWISREDGGCKTLEEVKGNGNLKVVSSTSHSLHIEYDYFSRIIVEIMRADLDEDGIEDILVYWYDSSLQGTYKNGGTFVLTRRAADAPFERLSSWPEWKNPLQLWGRETRRHRDLELMRYLEAFEAEMPAGKIVHFILHNYRRHKHPQVQAWLDRHPRFVFHYTPKSASWLNAVDRFFTKLTTRRLKRGVFRSLVDLQPAIKHLSPSLQPSRREIATPYRGYAPSAKGRRDRRSNHPTSRSRRPIRSNEQRSLNQDLRGDPAQNLDPWCSAGRRSQRC